MIISSWFASKALAELFLVICEVCISCLAATCNRANVIITWPQGSTGVQRYGCIPRSAANNLGEIPQKLGAPNPLFWRGFGGRERFGTRPCQSPSRFWIRQHFLHPHFPSPKLHPKIIGELFSVKISCALLRSSQNQIGPFLEVRVWARALSLRQLRGIKTVTETGAIKRASCN